MKLIVTLILFAPILLFGQSAIPKAVNETVNVTSRAKKGDLQRYEVWVESRALSENSTPLTYKRDLLAFSQYCASNTPEKGLDYKITIDSFAVGQNGPAEKPDLRLQTVRQLDGFSIPSMLTRAIPKKGECYDQGIVIPDSLIYVEIFDFAEAYKYARLIEQLRYSAASQLTKIGDSAKVTIPYPLCMKIESVVRDYKLNLAPMVLELTGLTNVQNRPCAIVYLHPSTSPLSIEHWAGPTASYYWEGSLTITASFLIALDDGDILAAKVSERGDAQVSGPNGKVSPSHRVRNFEFRQIN
ncbi:MAG: hypothetical protein IPH59_09075 [bacterium]|nr:hypothetical protein [bacterium]